MMNQLRWIAVLCGTLGSLNVASAQIDEEFQQYPKGWYLGIQREADTQLELMTAAYDLNDAQREVLANHFKERIHEQHAYMENPPSELKGLTADKLEGREEEVLAEITAFYETMPMNPDRVADWLEEESGLLEVGQAPMGRLKLTELRHRDLQYKAIKSDDVEDKVAVGRKLKLQRANCIAAANNLGQYLPAGVRTSTSRKDRQLRWHIGGTAMAESSGDSRNQVGGAATALQPLPCFDPWREAAGKICVRARREKPAEIEALWSEFAMRAWRRIALDQETFDAILAASSNDRVEQILTERGIQGDLDALFQELRIRLEAIEASCR